MSFRPSLLFFCISEQYFLRLALSPCFWFLKEILSPARIKSMDFPPFAAGRTAQPTHPFKKKYYCRSSFPPPTLFLAIRKLLGEKLLRHRLFFVPFLFPLLFTSSPPLLTRSVNPVFRSFSRRRRHKGGGGSKNCVYVR